MEPGMGSLAAREYGGSGYKNEGFNKVRGFKLHDADYWAQAQEKRQRKQQQVHNTREAEEKEDPTESVESVKCLPRQTNQLHRKGK
ncbi:hypothetical protein R1sor_012845 [Riccia sorocarpa]|uniref:Uncharacterized protein n=1 Tax=Riccia sorocarpa TaxID=122646 RepID=A0ABD3I6T9_9MARC